MISSWKYLSNGFTSRSYHKKYFRIFSPCRPGMETYNHQAYRYHNWRPQFGSQLKASWKPLEHRSTTVMEGLRGAVIKSPILPIGASYSVSGGTFISVWFVKVQKFFELFLWENFFELFLRIKRLRGKHTTLLMSKKSHNIFPNNEIFSPTRINLFGILLI